MYLELESAYADLQRRIPKQIKDRGLDLESMEANSRRRISKELEDWGLELESMQAYLRRLTREIEDPDCEMSNPPADEASEGGEITFATGIGFG